MKCWLVSCFLHRYWHLHLWIKFTFSHVGFSGDSVVKNLSANAGDTGDASSVPELGRSLGGGNGNQLQCSCLENSMDRGPWWATFHVVAQRWTWPSTHTHIHTHTHTHTSSNTWWDKSMSLPRSPAIFSWGHVSFLPLCSRLGPSSFDGILKTGWRSEWGSDGVWLLWGSDGVWLLFYKTIFGDGSGAISSWSEDKPSQKPNWSWLCISLTGFLPDSVVFDTSAVHLMRKYS